MPVHAAPLRLPASPVGASVTAGLTWPPRAFCASLRPRAAMFLAALTSRSWTVPHAVHCQVADAAAAWGRPSPRTRSTPGWSARTGRLCGTAGRTAAALYSSMVTNADQPASWTDLASRVRARPLTDKSSTVTAWFSRMTLVESLWWKSRRASATCACARATVTRALSRLLSLPACGTGPAAPASASSPRAAGTSALRPWCRRPSRRSGRGRGLSRTPRPVAGSGRGVTSTTNEAKNRPAASLITVTEVGTAGRARDQRTCTSPIFGSRSLPLPSTRTGRWR